MPDKQTAPKIPNKPPNKARQRNPLCRSYLLSDLLEVERTQPPIVVPTALRNPHRLIASTREWEQVLAEHERRSKRREFAYEPLPPRKNVLSFDVSPAESGRALRILDALLKAFEARRYGVHAAGEGHRESSRVAPSRRQTF